MSSGPNSQPGTAPDAQDHLNGWKEIAAFLGKGVRTVQRWEREQGLPVHRLQHLQRNLRRVNPPAIPGLQPDPYGTDNDHLLLLRLRPAHLPQ